MIPFDRRVADPSPGPDELAADKLDGLVSPDTSLARLAPVLACLPPEIADAIAAAYTHACRLSPAEREHYRPNIAAIARSCGLAASTFRDAVRRAEAAASDIRNAAPGVRQVGGSPFRRRRMPTVDGLTPSPRLGSCGQPTRKPGATNGAAQCARLTRAKRAGARGTGEK